MINVRIQKEFLMTNKLKTDERIVYAQEKEVYMDEYEGYEMLKRVVVINERTGEVTKFISMGSNEEGIWMPKSLK